MELRLLQYFLAVCREENMTRAADMLHLTQPTLSRQIAQLEEELGAPLFIRGRHLALTEAGMKLRRRAEEIMQLMDKIEIEFKEQEEVAGVVSIGAGGLSSFRSLSELMHGFQKLYPRVQFDFYTNNAEFVKERWGLLMRTDHPLAAKASVTREDLRSVPLMTSNRLAIRQEISHWFGDMMDELNIVATHNIITNVVDVVDIGAACAFTVEGAVSLFEGGRLTFRPVSPALEMNTVLAWKKFNPFFNAAGKFLEYFKTMYVGK